MAVYNLKPFSLSSEAVAKAYSTSLKNGLTKHQVAQKQKELGLNKLPEHKSIGYFSILLHQFKSPLIYVLLIAGIVSIVLGHFIDALFMVTIVLVNAIIGTIQESKAIATLESLKSYLVETSTVVREGKKQAIQAQDLVLGDIILLRSGERVPADARIIDAANVKVDEAILTGESSAIEKHETSLGEDAPIYEQANMLFSGTHILWGTARALVTATGQDTELGSIQQAVTGIEAQTPLQRQIGSLANNIVIVGAIVWIFLLGIGFLLGHNFTDIFMLFTSLMVSAIPEGLPIVVTVVLAAGAYAMAQKNLLVKKLEAVEGLARADVIAVDKTGTLTRNEMMVLEVFAGSNYYTVTGKGYHATGEVYHAKQSHDEPVLIADIHSADQPGTELYLLGRGCALISKTFVEYNEQTKQFVVRGEPLEAAVSIFAQKLGFDPKKLQDEYERIAEMPFNIDLRLQISAFQVKEDSSAEHADVLIYAMGSPEGIIEASQDASPADTKALNEFLDKGLRLIALAYRKVSFEQWMTDKEQRKNEVDHLTSYLGKLSFLGICGLQDAIRSDVKGMILKARDSGLSIVMATGDHLKTATFVGREVGIYRPGDITLTSEEFEKMSDKELLSKLDRLTVCARFSPVNKQRLIKLYHKQHKIVTMTGDGVNDSPSLAAADLGIAMGTTGSEVAKEAADMILLDDSFANIIRAIEIGRHIFFAIRRIIAYLFATNLSEILIITSAFLFLRNDILPLLPAQILWLNLVTDGLLDIALGFEPQEKNLLRKDTLRTIKRQGLLDKEQVLRIAYIAIYMSVISLAIFIWYKQFGARYARTMTLLVMATLQWANAWNSRSERSSIFKLGLLANKPLLLATGCVVLLQIAATYLPLLNVVLKTEPLSAFDWVLALAVAFFFLCTEEMRKYIMYRQ